MRALALAALLSACSVPGTCDEAASTAVAFTDEGVPAYEGQALLVRSCGFGAYCHSEDIDPEARRGVAVGLDFDVRIASVGPRARVVEVDRLGRNQVRTLEQRLEIYEQVDRGFMPPGEEGREILAGAPVYRRGTTDEPLPEIDTPDGLEILRNWLACGTPVIERTQPRGDGVPNTVGFTVPLTCSPTTPCRFPATARCDPEMSICVPCEGDDDCTNVDGAPICDAGECVAPIDPTWASIYDGVIAARCATGGCHVPGREGREPAGGLDLSERVLAHAQLVNQPAGGSAICRAAGAVRVVPGEPDASLLVQKLEGEDATGLHVCSERMPLGRDPIPARHLMAIREWVASGAASE